MGFRLFCCAVVFSCAAFFGFEKRRRMNVRLSSLKYFRDYFRSVRSYISHVGMSLDDIAFAVDNGCDSHKFSSILREKLPHYCFSQAFAYALTDIRYSLCITDDDSSLLCALAGKIGSSDIDGALELLKLGDEQLSELVSSAKEKCETDGRLCVVLGAACGAVAALLLF